MNKCNFALQTSLIFDDNDDIITQNQEGLGPWFMNRELKQGRKLQKKKINPSFISTNKSQKRIRLVKTERLYTEKPQPICDEIIRIKKSPEKQKFIEDQSPIDLIIKKHFSNRLHDLKPNQKSQSFVNRNINTSSLNRTKRLKICCSDIPLLNQYNYLQRNL